MTKLKVQQLIVGQLQTNCYLVSDPESRETMIVDPGDDADYIGRVISDHQLKPSRIVATHGHFDHLMAASELKLAYDIPLLTNQADVFLLDRAPRTAKHFLGRDDVLPAQVDKYLKESDEVTLGSAKFKVLATPGHTPGSISLYCQDGGMVFCGDVLFAGGGIGRTDFAYSDFTGLQQSIRKILRLPEETVIYSGHGEETTVGEERELFSSWPGVMQSDE